jgi:glycosyltransferase involved in cell wall biosynthesis
LIATSNNQPYKDYPTLIEALSKFNDKEITLDIYGGNMQGLQKLTAGNTIAFKGSVADVTEHMDGYSAFIITSKSGEGFSLALLEAMGSGLPVVCSDIPQFLEAVGDTAVVFRRGDVNSLVSQLRRLQDNPGQLQLLASRALERAGMFSKERFQKSMSRIYRNLSL